MPDVNVIIDGTSQNALDPTFIENVFQTIIDIMIFLFDGFLDFLIFLFMSLGASEEASSLGVVILGLMFTAWAVGSKAELAGQIKWIVMIGGAIVLIGILLGVIT